MEAMVNIIPAPLALILMLVGFAALAVGCIRLGYGAAVRNIALNLIDQAEEMIQGTKRGAERKAWVAKKLRDMLNASKWGKLISWAITDETIGKVIQFFFDRARAALSKEA